MSAAELFGTSPRVAATGENPFKFLDYYEETDAEIFAGRSEEITTILADFAYGATYVLYGRSGLGKTSIVKAGLIPRLERIGYLPIYIRLLDDPERELCREIAKKLGREEVDVDEIPDLLASVPPSDRDDLDDTTVTPVVLIFDQFEEFFIRFREKPPLRKRFAELLGLISRKGGAAVRIVFSLREDYLAELNDLRPQLPDILARSHRLLPLTAVGAREAILVTLKYHGVPYEDAVPGLLVRELERHGFSPLVLQIYCSEVYKAAKERNAEAIHLRAQDVKKVGTVEEVYKRNLEAVTAGLTGDRLLLACCILDVLRTADDTKRVVRVNDLALDGESPAPLPVYFNVSADEAEEMLDFLRSRSVVRRLPSEESWYELLHDGIVPVLTQWLSTKKEFRNFRDADRLVDNLHVMEESYLNDRQLRQAVDPYQRLLRLTPPELAYLFRSCVYEQGSSTSYWAQRYDAAHGAGEAETLIRDAIKSPETRQAALVAAGRTGIKGLAPDCLEQALYDKRPAVRRAAGCAYGQIGNIDYDAIHTLRRRPGTAKRAIELLADLAMQDKPIEQMGRFTRWRVNRVVANRKLSEGAELIRNRKLSGVAAAPLGALFVVAALTPAFYVVTSTFNDTEPTEILTFCLGTAVALALVGMYLGRRSAERVARNAVLEQSERWSSRAVALWEADLVLFLFAVWFLAILNANSPNAPRKTVHLLGALVLLGIAAGTVRPLWRGRAAGREYERAMRRLILCAIGLALYAAAFYFDVMYVATAVAGTLLARALLGWAVRMVQRRLGPRRSVAAMGLRASQLAYVIFVIPALLCIVIPVPLVAASARAVVRDLRDIVVLAAVILGIRAPVTAFALAWAQTQHPLASEGLQTREDVREHPPVALMLAIPLAIFLFLFLFGTDSTRLFAEEERAGTAITRTFPKYWPRTYFVNVVPRHGDLAVVSSPTIDGRPIRMTRDELDATAISRSRPLRVVFTNRYRLRRAKSTLLVPELPIGNVADARLNKPVVVKLRGGCTGLNTLVVAGKGKAPPLQQSENLAIKLFAVSDSTGLYGFTGPKIAATVEPSPNYYDGPQIDVPVKGGFWQLANTVEASRGTACRKAGTDVTVLAVAKVVVEEPQLRDP